MWLSVDPWADKYPNLSPYAFVANNPIMLVDPDGNQIDIVGEDGNTTTYTPGMKYEGNDEFTAKMVNTYNDMYNTDAGKQVVDKLVGTDNFHSVTKDAVPTNNNKNIAGYVANKDGNGGTFYMNGETEIGVTSHESFHAYQYEMGQGGPSINNEVEAYLFQAVVESQVSLGVFSLPTANNSIPELSQQYTDAMGSLLFEGFSQEKFETARYFFRSQSTVNGPYKNPRSFPLYRVNQKETLIKPFLPL